MCGNNHLSKVLSFSLPSFSKKQHENKYVRIVNGKGKGKVYPTTGHEGPEGE